MASDALYQELAKALSQPSRTYRAVQAGLDIPTQALQGYLSGSDIADKIKERRLQNQTLSEILGVNTPSGLGQTTVRQANAIVKPVEAYAALEKALQEKKAPPTHLQQVQGQLFNGRPGVFDPTQGIKNHMFYADTMEPIDFGQGIPTPTSQPFSSTSQNPTARGTPAVITPRIAPTIPVSESDKLADLNAMKEALNVAKNNFSPDFVGPINARKLSLAQTVNAPSLGLGATDKGALFTQSVQDIKDRLLRARSGAQINEQEYNRLVTLVPDQYKSTPDFLAKLQRFNQVLDSTISSKRQELMRAGYRGASTLPNNRPNPPEQQNGDPLGLFK